MSDDFYHYSDYVSDALKVISNINAKEVCSKVEKHKPLLCNQQGCDEVLSYLEKLQVK
jgi:hypothetical protein